MSNVLILKLNSGEELLTEVLEKNGIYLCSDVLQILSYPDEESGQLRMGLMEFMPYANKEGGVAIPTNMAIIAIPSDDLLNKYQEKFGKIITPSSKKIII